jgi:asparagine synthase (glutamine-hydrolysing)
MVVSWDRTGELLAGEQGVVCIWSTGFIANRTELLKQYQLPPDSSDAQLIATLYQQTGVAAANLLFGACAWVVWDGRRRQLVAACDRIGFCPLYYAQHGSLFAIAERVEQLLTLLPAPAINMDAVVSYLNGLVPQPPQTYYQSVHRVESGGYILVRVDQLESGRYWQLQSQPPLKLDSDDAYAEAFRQVTAEAIAGYITPVPMGITTSSGMDSNTIAATIRAIQPSADLTGFTWTTPELPDSDESRFAQAVWQKLNFPGVTIRADCYWPLSHPEGIRTTRSSPHYNYYTELWDAVFDTMRQHGIQVAFTGLSDDRQFGGHDFAYLELLLTGRWLELTNQIRAIYPISRYRLPQLFWRIFVRPAVWSTFPRRKTTNKIPVPWLSTSARAQYDRALAPPRLTLSLRPAHQQIVESIANPLIAIGMEPIGWQANERHIELRHPLMDHRLLEFALRLPLRQTVRAGQHKIIMRHAMRGRLPDSVLNLRRKILPTAVANRGLKEREQAKVRALMHNMRAAEMGLVDEKKLQAAYDTFVNSNQTSAGFWHTITLEDWLRRYF